MLEHHADLVAQALIQLSPATIAADVRLALKTDGSALDTFQPHQDPQQRALATAARANDHQAVIGTHVQVHVVHHHQLLAVGFAHVAQLDEVAGSRIGGERWLWLGGHQIGGIHREILREGPAVGPSGVN
ncbi:hypothetical protein D3C78_1468240 [compost metagenome]